MSCDIKPGYYDIHPDKHAERILLKIAKGVDPYLANKATNQLIIENEPFLKSFIKDWINPKSKYDFDYVLQEARVSFFTALQNYDLTKNVSIRYFAKYYLLALKEELFKKTPLKSVSDLAPYCIEVEHPTLPERKHLHLQTILSDAINSVLTEVEKEVITLHFFDHLKQHQIATRRKCSPARISVILDNSYKKMKEYLGSLGITPGFIEFN